jgi:hypothetical protein
MLGNMENRVAVPLCIYVGTAIWCWLTPSSLMIDEREFVQNIFPTKALALATAALAIVHWAFALRGRIVLGVAGLWAVATAWMVTMFIVFEWLTALTESVTRFVYILTVGGAAGGLCILGWHLVRRRRLAGDVHWIARGLVVLGVAGLAINYVTLALRAAGVLEEPSGLSGTADMIAGLTLGLWINSAIMLLGAASHVARSRFRSQPSAT